MIKRVHESDIGMDRLVIKGLQHFKHFNSVFKYWTITESSLKKLFTPAEYKSLPLHGILLYCGNQFVQKLNIGQKDLGEFIAKMQDIRCLSNLHQPDSANSLLDLFAHELHGIIMIQHDSNSQEEMTDQNEIQEKQELFTKWHG